MPTEVWFRNPSNYIRELVECGVGNVVWDRGALVKKSIEPSKHADLFYGQSIPYRVLVVGDQGTAELGPGRGMDNPIAVYPTWVYGESTELLYEIIEQPVGEDPNFCNDKRVEPDERPVFGQEHRVVIMGLPPANQGPGRKVLTMLRDLQLDNPDCIIHIHGLYSYRVAFGMGFQAADVEPRTSAHKGKVVLPSGEVVLFEHTQKNAKWLGALGFKPSDLSVPRNRCMYNIKSAQWAGENYEKFTRFRTTPSPQPVDIKTPDAEYKPVETKSHLTNKSVKAKDGDKFTCDTCSLQAECKFQRAGAVCSVPDAEPASLANFFKTRDSEMILDGLAVLVQANTRRLERGMQEEEAFGDINPEVTKLLNGVFNQAAQLAKLSNPNLHGGKVNVNVVTGAGGQSAVAVTASNSNELIGGVVRSLEARGWKREDITPELVESVLMSAANPGGIARAIEGHIVNKGD